MSRAIAIAGSLAQRPRHGGLTWVFLQYLLGFRRLGFEVLLLDRLSPDMCLNRAGEPCHWKESENVKFFVDLMERTGLRDCFSLNYNHSEAVLGLSQAATVDRLQRCECLLNVMGFLDDQQLLEAARRRVFLDIDPGFGQMWRELGLHDIFAGHDDHVTIGENIGQPECEIPTCGLNWITTPQPVVLEHWPVCRPTPQSRFTSVVSWRGPFGPIEYAGRTYGLRVHEFRKFIELPRLSGEALELALDIHPSETKDLALLKNNGWLLVDPLEVAGDPWAYQAYVQQSKAELMIAKNLYVDTNSAWFSDRSICYLASGKPVLAQDTGLKTKYPTTEGLLIFSTMDEAIAGVETISQNYARHARAAREIAEEYFDSDKVLNRLLGKLGIV